MADSSSVETDVELELYEEIVGNLNHITPVTERPSRSISYSDNRHCFQKTHHYKNQREHLTSASAAIVDSVTWPDPRSLCSIAGNNIKCHGRLRSARTEYLSPRHDHRLLCFEARLQAFSKAQNRPSAYGRSQDFS